MTEVSIRVYLYTQIRTSKKIFQDSERLGDSFPHPKWLENLSATKDYSILINLSLWDELCLAMSLYVFLLPLGKPLCSTGSPGFCSGPC